MVREWRGGECAQSGAETTCFVHLGSDDKDVTSEAFEHVTNVERSKCTAGVGHKEYNGVTEVVRTLIERKAYLWSRKTLAELAKKLIGRHGHDPQRRERIVQYINRATVAAFLLCEHSIAQPSEECVRSPSGCRQYRGRPGQKYAWAGQETRADCFRAGGHAPSGAG
eukprot:4431261-Prymnesium_polylepis.4